jgi:hypothetical protein
MKIKFTIPNTQFVIVLWFRNNRMNRTTIERPANTDMLQLRMLKEKVGMSEIRALRPVDGIDLVKSMTRI